MSEMVAWDIINKQIRPRLNEIGVEVKFPYGTIHSQLDWENGVALWTKNGTIHVLGTGEIVDNDNILKYK